MLCVNSIQIAHALAALSSKPARRMPYGSIVLVFSLSHSHGARNNDMLEPTANAPIVSAPPSGFALNDAIINAE